MPLTHKSKTSLWVASTYFTEGLPYMITRVLSSVFFTDMGVRESFLGFLNFLGIPWNLKFLWAPLLDIFSTKRQWLLRVQSSLALVVLGIAMLAGFSSENPGLLPVIAFLFVGLAFLAATNDVAIDAYYLEGLPDKSEQAAYSGLRTLAYRAAVIYARTLLVAIAGFMNWAYGFGVGAVTLAAFFLLHAKFLPHVSMARATPKNFSAIRQGFADSFRTYLSREKIGIILLFIITYKLGDEILFSMNTPFLMRELGVTKPQIAWLGGFIGAFSTIGGTMLGAWWIQKKGLKKSIWPLTLLMNVNIAAYVLLSIYRPDPNIPSGMFFIALTHGYENVAAGLGSAALTVYLMRLCDVRYKAAHFAIGTAIMSLGSTVFGGFSGILVEKIGYTNLFLVSCAATLPSMILLFWIPMDQDTPSKGPL